MTTRNRPLKIGVVLPDTEREMGGGNPRWTDLHAMARLAEDAGFDSIWVCDHLNFQFEDHEPQGVWESFTLQSALAAITNRVEIGAVVNCTGYRNPAMIAKIATTIDEISNGRLILGLGAGWHEPEYRAFGFPYDHRVSRFEEALTIIHSLLREGYVDFEGTYYQARECEMRPRGPRPSGPPIMIGSTGPRMLGLLAKYGDIWNAWGLNMPAEVGPDREKVDTVLAANGRDSSTVARTVVVLLDMPGAAGRPRESGVFLSGTPEEIADAFRGYAQEGISHIQLMLDPNTLAGIESVVPVLEILDRG
jgi:alkanesulfonate monooxygenase SsuD/methylene tetrahydromethanopterin reductase-like flavin-dependent oxidoreductase (luciferase family)